MPTGKMLEPKLALLVLLVLPAPYALGFRGVLPAGHAFSQAIAWGTVIIPFYLLFRLLRSLFPRSEFPPTMAGILYWYSFTPLLLYNFFLALSFFLFAGLDWLSRDVLPFYGGFWVIILLPTIIANYRWMYVVCKIAIAPNGTRFFWYYIAATASLSLAYSYYFDYHYALGITAWEK